MTRMWWRDVWHSPMAAEFVEADKHGLYRLAVMVDIFWIRPSPSLSSEIRLGQQAFGLTPMDRRRLQWTIERAAKAMRRRAKPAPDGDPRERLRVLR